MTELIKRPRGRPRKDKQLVLPSKDMQCGCFSDTEGIVHQCNVHYKPTGVRGTEIHQKRVR